MSASDIGTDAAAALPLGGEMQAEASTSAVPTTSGRQLFEPLDEAKHSLNDQSEASAQMHPLNTALQSLYSASNVDGRLSRDQYRQLISQIRHSVSQFAASSPAIKSQASASSSSTSQQIDDAGTANQLRRYISLLTETSTHTAALAHSIAPIKSADRERNNAFAHSDSAVPFPQSLQAGVLRAGSSQQPTTSWENALETLGSLCETLENTAKTLGLETFAEPSSEASTAPSETTSASVLSHTLTLGAKILVIDVEFLVNRTAQGFRPKCKLKLSYATDSADSQPSRDPRLGAVLECDLQFIADKLFGPAASNALPHDRSLVVKALANWTANLNELLVLDNLEAKATEAAPQGTRTTDLFAAMQELCSAAVRISDAESASFSTPADLLDRGHGLHKFHDTKPFLRAVFASDPTSNQQYTLSLGVQALDLAIASQPLANVATPSFPVSPAAEDLLTSSAANDPARSLGSIPSPTDSKKRVPLHFVVRLSPPVVVTRPTAAKLASICNLKQTTPHNNAAGASVDAPAGATWFEDVLAASWSRRPQQTTDDTRKPARCTFTLAQTVESVRSTESQGLVIDSLPLLSASSASGDAMDDSDASHPESSTLARFFAAIEVLRDEVKVTELMHSAIASSQDPGDSEHIRQTVTDDLSLDDMLASASDQTSSKIPVTLAFRTPVRGSTDEARQVLSLELAFRVPTENDATVVFDASVSPSRGTPELGWSLSAEAKLASSGHLSTKSARFDSSSPEAHSIAAKLTDLESLENVVLGLVDWAEKQLGMRLKKPAAQATFDPLTYEQQNVHAIYETIAPHFSSTRYKPWPLIPAFLSTIPAGSLGADLGCGNGKYLPIRSTLALPMNISVESALAEATHVEKHQNSLLTVGVDRSSNLIGLARDNFGMLDSSDANKIKAAATEEAADVKRRQEVAVGDAIQSSLRTGLFDYAISIATIHHFSTWERRRASVQELIRIVAPVDPPSLSRDDVSQPAMDPRLEGSSGRGRFMIFVWALEQKDEGKRQFEAPNPETLKSKPEIHDPNHIKSKDRLVSYSGLQAAGQPPEADAKVTDDQDVLVPWVLTTSNKKAKTPKAPKGKKGQPKTRCADAGAIEAGMSEMNLSSSSTAAPTVEQATDSRPVYNRYYHMFRTGELEALVADAAASMAAVHHRRGSAARAESVEVVREAGGWERGNWWGVWRVQWRCSASEES
ncbi:uncharacterized protein UTRI_03512_B [Ustilago trichophora]|uniref:Uncharacterized protein n=1 Tax=Ustilago trichophora TaxID=86804 RepID=A0A5C3DZS4_9BASI|nr:uncharacterized protein UTRI_03512_B [Ustilago trichophora]